MSNPLDDCGILHVWKLEGGQGGNEDMTARHIYGKYLNHEDFHPAPSAPLPGHATAFSREVISLAVAKDGEFYMIRQEENANHAAGVSYILQSFQVATGNRVTEQIIRMPATPRGLTPPRYTTKKLMISGDYLLLSHQVEVAGPFLGIGLGMYAFRRSDLSQTCYLSCFEQGEVCINCDDSRQTDKWIIWSPFDRIWRKIQIDSAGVLSTAHGQVTFAGGDDVKLAWGDQVFVENSDEDGTVRLDQYNVATGAKIRTIATGVPGRGHMVASVLGHGKRVFCLISAIAPSTEHVIQSFLFE